MNEDISLPVPAAAELIKNAADNLWRLPIDHPAWAPSLRLIQAFGQRMEEKYVLLVGPLPDA